jgi:hypothetical protein
MDDERKAMLTTLGHILVLIFHFPESKQGQLFDSMLPKILSTVEEFDTSAGQTIDSMADT